MNAKLAGIINSGYYDPSNKSSFFNKADDIAIRDLEKREKNSNPLQPCHTNLFIGSFFDGTGNNYEADLAKGDKSQSNVARLYSAYPGLSVPGVLPLETEWVTDIADYQNYFRIYSPGIGTRFTQVGDSGEGFWDETLGGGTGRLGEVRIVWALAQIINVISRYFIKRSIISNEDVKNFYGDLTAEALSVNIKQTLEDYDSRKVGRAAFPTSYDRVAVIKLSDWLKKLYSTISPHMIEKGGDGLPNNKDPGILQNIYLSTFGFSRGSALARVYSNWVIKLFKIDAYLTQSNGLTLAGFPVTYDYLGLFDTVASVGIVNMIPFKHGHMAWADAEVSLAIPPEVARCYHLVAAHENRRSFPLDSIYNSQSMPANGEEVVFPGAHSDLGGGYGPGVQGKGEDEVGRDQLSRIPLAVMYRDARISGVPLKLEKALGQDKVGFEISPKLIDDFNSYIASCQIKSGETGRIIREHWKSCIEWRFNYYRNGGISSLESYKRASQFYKNNLDSAYTQFCDEMEEFKNVEQHLEWRDTAAWKKILKYAVMGPGWKLYRDYQYGFDASVLDDWEKVAIASKSFGTPSSAISTMLDKYVHDSIAGFLTKWSSKDEVIIYLKTLISIRDIRDKYYYSKVNSVAMLTEKEESYIRFYEENGKIPPMDDLGGRESYWLGGGYLRFRRIYAGANDVYLARLKEFQESQYTERKYALDSMKEKSLARMS
ncbi:T6SS phospholipase effector Tle1-like catalytic domain-containing protein [Cobetia marina]|uniref:T6SS phospholipase effector Tle1-like catalytic domain-containing protein n=1 Tax=Cobetia marina TaxID=28258 RepID=UPI000A0095B2|nr:DUF2235 domain-containing protein [Cobetia marina]